MLESGAFAQFGPVPAQIKPRQILYTVAKPFTFEVRGDWAGLIPASNLVWDQSLDGGTKKTWRKVVWDIRRPIFGMLSGATGAAQQEVKHTA